ncbi:hypothetical protein KUTeg_016897 [Tegillarca granosa]|uniref:Fibronectin type-III domain-containing protein n=1 Tax=Tegillarca granosa TaxID=220873 RepID=A0ABQ9EM64_TEGGR|nr:hypothetical protein KUTeg_016897 [Tegillarca granosa]
MKKTYSFMKTSSYLWNLTCIMVVLLHCPETTLQKELKDVVRDFKCVTHNFDHYVNCTWKLDVTKREEENIELKVTWQVLYGHSFFLFRCPNQTKTSCVINIMEDNLDPDREVMFSSHVDKISRWRKCKFKFSRAFTIGRKCVIEFVKPYKVSDVSGNANSTCVNLSWFHSHNMFSLQYQIRYSNKWNDKVQEVTVIGDDFAEDDITRHTICNLQPYTTYTFRVRCKPQSGTGFWIPSGVPRIPQGGFRSIPDHHGTRNLELFWQCLEERQRNGDNIFYNLNVYRGESNVADVFVTTPKTSEKLRHLLQNNTYRVTINAGNEVGMSRNISSIFIPSVKDSTHHEIAIGIRKIYENEKVSIHWKFSSCAGEVFNGEVGQFIIHICRTQSCEEKEIHSKNGEIRSLLTEARQGETICATVAAELKDGRKIKSDKTCEKVDDFYRIPLEIIIPVSILILILVCLGAWCLSKTFTRKIQKCMKPYEIDVNPDYIEVTVTTPCIDGDAEETEPSESLTPTSNACLIPNLDSEGML